MNEINADFEEFKSSRSTEIKKKKKKMMILMYRQMVDMKKKDGEKKADNYAVLQYKIDDNEIKINEKHLLFLM